MARPQLPRQVRPFDRRAAAPDLRPPQRLAVRYLIRRPQDTLRHPDLVPEQGRQARQAHDPDVPLYYGPRHAQDRLSGGERRLHPQRPVLARCGRGAGAGQSGVLRRHRQGRKGRTDSQRLRLPALSREGFRQVREAPHRGLRPVRGQRAVEPLRRPRLSLRVREGHEETLPPGRGQGRIRMPGQRRGLREVVRHISGRGDTCLFRPEPLQCGPRLCAEHHQDEPPAGQGLQCHPSCRREAREGGRI